MARIILAETVSTRVDDRDGVWFEFKSAAGDLVASARVSMPDASRCIDELLDQLCLALNVDRQTGEPLPEPMSALQPEAVN